ncbi:MAG: aminodeoxychorismate lyase [Methylococcaceae bacterium]|nr:aminodeoxychorismate lyase [Methylococcaceae bacterium]
MIKELLKKFSAEEILDYFENKNDGVKWLINGEQHNELSISDRGFQYGDGLFETIEVLNGQLILFAQHCQRLTLGCKKLLLPEPNISLLKQEALALIKNCQHGVLKIIITRGSGGRGYRQPESIEPTRVLSLHPYPNNPDSFQQQGINAIFCQQRLGLNPTLAGLKHLNRLEQVLARAEWDSPVIQEGIMLDINDYVIEGTMSNVFFVKDNILYTPSLEQSGIAGIMRDFVLKMTHALAIENKQGLFTQQQLLDADEIFVTNSVIGIWAIKKLAEKSFSKGQITQSLQTALAEYKQQFI